MSTLSLLRHANYSGTNRTLTLSNDDLLEILTHFHEAYHILRFILVSIGRQLASYDDIIYWLISKFPNTFSSKIYLVSFV